MTAGPLPPLYARWIAEIVPGVMRGEPRSTCDDCAMCRERVAPFRPDVLCCGTHPVLPNFAVGRALRDGTPAGIASVRARIEARVAASPLGLGVPPDVAAAHQAVLTTTGFGSDPSVICPHFEGGRCGIWRARNAVCSTWFCRIDGQDAGRTYWTVLRALLADLERDLARHAARALGSDGASWGPWRDDRAAYYERCADHVEALEWAEIRRIGGFGLTVRTRELRAAHRDRAAAIEG